MGENMRMYHLTWLLTRIEYKAITAGNSDWSCAGVPPLNNDTPLSMQPISFRTWQFASACKQQKSVGKPQLISPRILSDRTVNAVADRDAPC